MRLQNRDGSFVDKLTAASNDFYRYYVKNIGENIYEKVNHFPHCQVKFEKCEGSKNHSATQEIDFLSQQFKIDLISEETEKEKIKKIPPKLEQNNTLDDLKKKCKLDSPPAQQETLEDNFQELLNMLEK